ncbi:adenylate/guanylate cyclase domain-containing protein [Pseudomonadota bacterium]
MRCSKCSTTNRSNRHFCSECSSPLTQVCIKCSFENLPAERFCGGCGENVVTYTSLPVEPKPLAANDQADNSSGSHSWRILHRDSPAAERRQLTVLFSDLVDSTGLSMRLDPEELREIIRAYQSACSKVIQASGGEVARYIGDGIMAYFGYPQANEDDAERAVQSALGIVDAIFDLNRKSNLQDSDHLSVRIGIATGMVVAGDLIGDGAAEQSAVVGETPNLASRIQQICQPNEVVISEQTRQMVGENFSLSNLGKRDIKGSDAPLQIWKVRRSIPRRARLPANKSAMDTDLVGRDNEINQIIGCWQSSTLGQGQVALINGEAGIGKSRLAQATYERIRKYRPIYLHYQCSANHRNSMLHPFIRQLEWAANLVRKNSPEEKKVKLKRMLLSTAKRVDIALPLFMELLSIPQEDHHGNTNVSPQQRKHQTFSALLQILDKIPPNETAYLVFEDVHWADPTSLELLDLIVDRVRTTRVFVFITYRQEVMPRWNHLSHVTPIVLSRLNKAQSEIMINSITKNKQLPKELMEQIVIKTDGVPLFVEELTKTVTMSDMLRERADRYELSQPICDLSIPTTLQDSLMARLDRLGPAKRLAQICAACGREFSYDLIRKIVEESETQLRLNLKRLLDSEIITQRGSGKYPNYSFRHALIRDIAYQSLLKSNRKSIHASIAQALEANFSDVSESEPEILALHYTEGGLVQKAIESWIQAGYRALRRTAFTEALSHMEQGLGLIAAHPEIENHEQYELALQILKGTALRGTEGFSSPRTEKVFSRAVALATQLGDKNRLIEALRGVFSCYYVQGRLDQAQSLALQVKKMSSPVESASVCTVGNFLLGAVSFWKGNFELAQDELEQGYREYTTDNRAEAILSSQIDLQPTLMAHLAWTYWIRGFPDRATKIGIDSIGKAREFAQPFTLALTLFWNLTTQVCCGNSTEHEEMLTELRFLAKRHSLAYFSAISNITQGQIEITNGEFEHGRYLITSGIDNLKRQSSRLGHPWIMSILAEAYFHAKKFKEATALIDQGLQRISENNEHHWEAELYRLRAKVYLASPIPNHDKVEKSLHHAISIAQSQSANSLHLRAALDLALLLERLDRRSEAFDILSAIYGKFSEGFDTQDLITATRILHNLKVPS